MHNEVNNKIGIGILGYASIAERYMIPSLKRLNDIFGPIVLASRKKERLKNLSDELGIDVVASYQEVVDRKSVSAIYIPLPNSMHYEWAKKALLSNKHVLVEKSMCCTLEQVIELNDIARKKNLALMENFQFRFHNQLKNIIFLLANNEIGETRCIRANFGFPPFKDKTNIRYSSDLGGGALLDAGAYPLKLASVILGDDIYIDSASLHYDSSLGVDIWGSAQIKSKGSNVVLQCSFGFDNEYSCDLEIWGSQGILTSNRIFTAPPDYNINLLLKKNGLVKKIAIDKDNHFENSLRFFYKLCIGDEDQTRECLCNVIQARLIEQVRKLSDG